MRWILSLVAVLVMCSATFAVDTPVQKHAKTAVQKSDVVVVHRPLLRLFAKLRACRKDRCGLSVACH